LLHGKIVFFQHVLPYVEQKKAGFVALTPDDGLLNEAKEAGVPNSLHFDRKRDITKIINDFSNKRQKQSN